MFNLLFYAKFRDKNVIFHNYYVIVQLGYTDHFVFQDFGKYINSKHSTNHDDFLCKTIVNAFYHDKSRSMMKFKGCH